MVRVLSYNVNGLRGGSRQVADVVRACSVDVACVQESPQLLRWRAKCAELARQCGLRVIAGGRPAGLLILGGSRARVVHAEARWLSLVPRYLQRGLTLAVLDIDGARVAVGNMHLDLDLAGRGRHVAEVLARMQGARDRYDVPVVLAGDVNEQPAGPVWQALAGRLQDAHAVAPSGGRFTFPAGHPRAASTASSSTRPSR